MRKIKEKTYNEQQFIKLMNKRKRERRIKTIISGILLVGIGVATIPVPCGSLQMIGAGTILIVKPDASLKQMIKQMKNHFIAKIKMRKNFK